jgi:adenylate cyclase
MKTLAHTLLKRPVWLYASVSALAVVLMAAISACLPPSFSSGKSAWPAALGLWPDSSATERRVVVVDIDEKSTQA